MSAMALAPPDIAGLSASADRKASASPSRDAEAEEDFTAALARIADPAPAAGPVQPPASADDASVKSDAAPAAATVPRSPLADVANAKTDADLWKEFSACSDAMGGGAKGDAAVDPGAAVQAKSFAPPNRVETAPARETAPEGETSPPVSAAPTHAAALAIRVTISSKADEPAQPSGRLAAKSAEGKRAEKSPAASKPETRASSQPASPDLSGLNAPPPPLAMPPALAVLVPPPAAPALQTGAASGAGAPDNAQAMQDQAMQDAVARIGAALAGVGGAPGAGASADAQKPEPQESPTEDAAVSVHVVAQKTWLPPVSPPPGPVLGPASQDAAAPAPRATGDKFAETGGKAALAGEARDAPAAAAPEDTRSIARSGAPLALATAPAASHAPVADDNAKPAAPATAKAAPAVQTSASAPAPRRDLEITLAPKELGGLEVRMKSAGDRLELAFVTERGETARMISDKSVALESQLHGAGLGLGGIDISAAASGQGGGAAPGGGRETQEQPRASGGGESDRSPQSQTSSGRDRQERKDETQDQTAPRPRGDRGLYL